MSLPALLVLVAVAVVAIGGAVTLAVWLVLPSAVRRSGERARADTVQAVVDTVVTVASDRLSAEAAASAREAELRSQAVDQQLDAVQAALDRVGTAVVALQRERAQQHGELLAGLAEATRTTASLGATTGQLREALANPTARGRWGERMADDVLRLAGLTEGISYVRQRPVAGGGIPDVTFLLPGGRVLHMDVKFPLTNYLRAVEATDEAERASAEAQFLRDVRQRVRELDGRGYADPAETVGYLLLFIPNEAIYSFVHERDPDLVDHALGRQVVLCSPFTLFAVLAVVRQAVEALELQRATDDVLVCLTGFRDQWQRFGEAMDVVGKRLDSAQRAFEDLNGPRRRQLQRRLDDIDEVGRGRSAEALDLASGSDLTNGPRLVAR